MARTITCPYCYEPVPVSRRRRYFTLGDQDCLRHLDRCQFYPTRRTRPPQEDQ